MARPKRARLPSEPFEAVIDSLSKDCRGVAHISGKAVFIDGALPGEQVKFMYTERSRRYDEGRTVEVLKASPLRVAPRCQHFDICGGCALQHMAAGDQIRAKHEVLAENLKRLGHVEPERWLEPLTGPAWGYRRKARLGVRYVFKKERLLIGFREKQGGKLADIRQCEVLDPRIGLRLQAMAAMLESMEARESIPQVEIACGDAHCTMVVRHLQPLSEADRAKLIEFGRTHELQIELQPQGPDSITALWPAEPELYYELPDYGLRYRHRSTDFTQINAEINRRMVPAALALLDLKPHERVLDLFCGLGNFSLPMARTVAEVVGVEGEAAMVARAAKIARDNGISNASFHACNLDEDFSALPWFKGGFDAALLDPPRSGALMASGLLGRMRIPRIVYVSCHPASLARDADVLVNQHGYTLEAAGVMDMFPHTAHVESIAKFVLR